MDDSLLTKLPLSARWGILILLSGFLAAVLTLLRLPAALLLGPLIAGILVENWGGKIKVPAIPFSIAQGLIGCMIARTLTADIVHTFLKEWPIFVAVGLLVIVASCALGWVMSVLEILPETTAIWGLLPGAASAMMIMADSYGADSRLVAFMQYLRVVLVVFIASLVARFWVHASALSAAPVDWFPAIHWIPFAETLAIVAVGLGIGYWSRIPAGLILVPLFLGTVLNVNGWVTIELPRWLLACSYFLLGWTVGLRFTREILIYAARAFLQTLLATLAIILFCGFLAFGLVKIFGIDPLTAYFATSPGGMDAIAVVSASTHVDVGFIMSLQTARFMLVLLIGPVISRFFADSIKLRKSIPNAG